MGGGNTKIKETPKRLGTGEGSAGGGALSTSICERTQIVPMRLVGTSIAEGKAVRIVLGDPPAVIAEGRPVGHIADRRVAATLIGCLKAGYDISGEVVFVDLQAREATASVAGVRGQ
jgi:hypothetical protein